MASPLIDTETLSGLIGRPDIKIFDASWFFPHENRDAKAEFAAGHIPTAAFFDIDEVSDHANPLPHMLPDRQAFAMQVRRLGVWAEDRVIVYDSLPRSASRVWWSFRVMGHENVQVLDGGLRKWIAEGRPVETGWPHPEPGDFKAHERPELIARFDDVREGLSDGVQVIDARPAERFTGVAPEPRPGLRSGHMPGARSLPSAELVDGEGRFRSFADTAALLSEAGVDPAAPTIATCGSGVTAAMVALALARLGRWDVPVYDGSWAEWGARDDAPVTTGA